MSKKNKKPLMRKFFVNFTAEVELSQDVIDRGLSKEFRESMYEFGDPERVAEHIAYNMVRNNLELDLIEGFCDMNTENAVLKDVQVDHSEEYVDE